MESKSSLQALISCDSDSENLHNISDEHVTKVSPAPCVYEATERCLTPAVTSHTLIALNDNKAGMGGLDKERINKIIDEASKGSKFYENERRKEEVLHLRIREQQAVVDSISDGQLQFGMQQADQLLRGLEEERDLSHTIVHVDMDAFYAAVEMRDDPSLRNKPVAVGGMGMLSTSNYIARRFGVRAAMPGFIGRKLCPELVIVPPNYKKYTAVSETVREILASYDPNFLPMSLDEAYLDLTEHLQWRLSAPSSSRTFIVRTNGANNTSVCTCDLNLVLRPVLIGEKTQYLHSDEQKSSHDAVGLDKLPSCFSEESQPTTCPQCKKEFPPYAVQVYGVSVEEAVLEMRNRIQQRTNLTASAGIAPNTMLAKVCSDKNKPNGQFRILPVKEEVEQFISGLPVRKIPGIGKVTEKLLEALGVHVCRDLYDLRAILYHAFTPKCFHSFMSIAAGIGSSTLERDGERKSMSTEQTFGRLVSPAELLKKCQELCHRLATDLKDEQLQGKTVTLKIKTVDFLVKTRASTLSHYSSDESVIFAAAKQLLEAEMQALPPGTLHLRLMGIRMSKLASLTQSGTSKLASHTQSGTSKPDSHTQSGTSKPDSQSGTSKPDSHTQSGTSKPASHTQYGTSVASYFEKHCQKKPVAGNPVADGVSAKGIVHPDTSAHHQDLRSTDLYTVIDTHLLQDDGSSDDDCELLEVQQNEATESQASTAHTTSVGTKMSSSPVRKKDKINTQKTIDSFLCGKSRSYLTAEHRDVPPCTKSGSHGVLVTEDDTHGDMLTGCATLLPGSSAKVTGSSGHLHMKDSLVPACSSRRTSSVSEAVQKSNLPLDELTAQPEAPLISGMIHCPVCGQHKYHWPLAELNAHVDFCLSRSAIKDILSGHQDQHSLSPASAKRMRTDKVTQQKVDKRVKTQHTLFSFFKP